MKGNLTKLNDTRWRYTAGKAQWLIVKRPDGTFSTNDGKSKVDGLPGPDIDDIVNAIDSVALVHVFPKPPLAAFAPAGNGVANVPPLDADSLVWAVMAFDQWGTASQSMGTGTRQTVRDCMKNLSARGMPAGDMMLAFGLTTQPSNAFGSMFCEQWQRLDIGPWLNGGNP